MAATFIEGVPEYEIRAGNMHIMVNGFHLAMPLKDFIAGHELSGSVIEEHRARNAEIVLLALPRRWRPEH